MTLSPTPISPAPPAYYGAAITIIVPFRGRAEGLRRMLESIARCAYRPLRLILVNNCPEDIAQENISCLGELEDLVEAAHAAEAFAERWRSDDFDITLCHEPQRGAAAARNRGLALCRTPWVYFFDSDDLFDPRFLDAVTPALSDDIDLCAVPVRMVWGKDGKVRPFVTDGRVESQILVSHLNTPAMVLRTDFLRHIGGWNARLAVWNDWELGLHSLVSGARVRWLTEHGAMHRVFVHPDSITGHTRDNHAAAPLLAMRRAEELVAALGGDSGRAARRALYYRYCIIEAQWRRAHDTAAAQAAARQRKSYGAPWSARCLGTLLRLWTRWGGRGAWRIALRCCQGL